MSAMYDPALNEMDDGRKGEVESLLGAVVEALEGNPDCSASYVNEFGDFTIAIPLNGDQDALDKFIEKQVMIQCLENLADRFVSYVRKEGSDAVTCSFIGFDRNEAPWIAEDNDQTHRVGEFLRPLVNSLSMHGVDRYLVGGSLGFDPIVTEAIQRSNAYLETMKEWEEVLEDWKPAEIEELPTSSEADALLVSRADIIVALAHGDGGSVSEGFDSHALKLLARAAEQDKPAFVFWTSFFESEWPDADKMVTLQSASMLQQLIDEISE